MHKRIGLLMLIGLLAVSKPPIAQAALPTFDAVNAALQELQNVILNNNFVENLALAADRLDELKAQTLEMFRFHSGLDEILDLAKSDPLRDFTDSMAGRIRTVFSDSAPEAAHIEILQSAGTPEDLRSSLEALTGSIPEGNERSHIPFEEMQVIEAFDLAGRIREAGKDMRDAARSIGDQAKAASPKGAAKLQAQGISELMILGQQNQEAIAKLLELEATQIEQVSRREKEAERERLRFVRDADEYLGSILSPAERISL
ncbi:hypothetical protein N9K06_01580 [Omnitrophica bacterium]|nr:hypothetical protein [Candidatus Omnitrophota bacterium]